MPEKDKSEDGEGGGIRVVDRRGFTAEGQPRRPDAMAEESAEKLVDTMPPPDKGRGDGSAASESKRSSVPADSAQFQNLVLNLARQAAAYLGAAKNPLTGQVEVDIGAAQQVIDLLQALRAKTRGNLSSEETELIEGLITDLQLQYVTARSKTSRTS